MQERKNGMLLTPEAIKEVVKERYGAIARAPKKMSCCGPSDCCGDSLETTFLPEEYKNLEGRVQDADLGLGCGIPTDTVINEGDTVVDLGSGAGTDVFIARRKVGESGRVIGVDMTPDMVERARKNAQKLGFTNVEFHLGEIEKVPLPSNTADLVVSNCVFNLLPDKRKGFDETFRILKPGAHFSISDMVVSQGIPAALQKAAALYTGCVAGALVKEDYLETIRQSGFVNIQVRKERVIEIAPEEAEAYLSREELEQLRSWPGKILSITVTAEKPRA